MAVNIIVPSLGESLTEATVAKWHKKIGDQVRVDELLVELETDKITFEVNAPTTGTVTERKFSEGDVVVVSEVLGKLEEGEMSAKQQCVKEKPNDTLEEKNSLRNVNNQIFSPAARKIATENNIQRIVNTTGKDGRVTKGDILSAISNAQSQSYIMTQSNKQLEQKVKMTRLRKTIAKRLKDSQNTAAILSTFNEVDMSAIIKFRKEYQDIFKEKHGVKLGFMSFFVKATVEALKEVPIINAEIDGDYLVYKNYYNIGIAIGLDQGLVVPVVKDADTMNHPAIEKNILALGTKARKGKLEMSDMQGGTFSITNGGIYGSLFSTPIINPPQSGILGMHNIIKRPVVIADEIVIRPMMYTALSYDHRIIDGGEAATFLRRIKEMVEAPEKLLFGL